MLHRRFEREIRLGVDVMEFVRLLLVTCILASTLPCQILSQSFKGDACHLTNGASGRCEMIDACQPVYRDLLTGIRPDTLCGFSGFDPIVCCPTAGAAPTQSTTQKFDLSSIDRTTRPSSVADDPDTDDLDTIEPRKLGDLARRTYNHRLILECAEYARSVYALVEPPTLSTHRRLVNVSLCAIKSKTLIVGGTKAEPKEFPHMAAVGFRSGSSDEILWLCGGTLVSDKFVMTAAHCTHSLQFGNAAMIRVGDTDLVSSEDDARLQERRVVERIRYPGYRKPAEYHDLALLRLESRVILDAYVRPACLPVSRRIENNEAIATGWGRVNWADDDGSSHLLKVTLETVSHSICNASFSSGGAIDLKLRRGIVDDWQICAGREGKDTCQGDSGGPLVVFDPDHECMYDVVGITSLGRLCGSTVPGVYTRVYNYLSWLEETIWR